MDTDDLLIGVPEMGDQCPDGAEVGAVADHALQEQSEQLPTGGGLSQEADQQRVCRTKWQATAPRHSEC